MDKLRNDHEMAKFALVAGQVVVSMFSASSSITPISDRSLADREKQKFDSSSSVRAVQTF